MVQLMFRDPTPFAILCQGKMPKPENVSKQICEWVCHWFSDMLLLSIFIWIHGPHQPMEVLIAIFGPLTATLVLWVLETIR